MPGAAALRLALEGGTTHSQIEREFKAWLKSRGIRLPSRNHEIGAIRVDCLWEDAALVVEVDTFGTHGTPFSFEDDRQRDAYLLARGFRTLRVTPQRWRLDGERLEREIRSALART
jgi:very-short-patch-repair endonuclease